MKSIRSPMVASPMPTPVGPPIARTDSSVPRPDRPQIRFGPPDAGASPPVFIGDVQVDDDVPFQEDELAVIRKMPSWLVSLCVHMAALILLALLIVPVRIRPLPLQLSLNSESRPEDFDDDLRLDATFELSADEFSPTDLAPLELQPELPDQTALFESLVDTSVDSGEVPLAQTTDLFAEVGSVSLSVGAVDAAFAGREARRVNAVANGASAASEEAVDLALRWLADHQNSDGSWNFDLRRCRCGRCGNPGSAVFAQNGATGLALLPFLGAGETHLRGNHRATVAKGVRYLLRSQESNGSFWDRNGTMYSHGIATLAICEAYAMSAEWDEAQYQRKSTDKPFQDPELSSDRLREAARRAINFTVRAQHVAGGWRYQPQQAGDTSVVGWQAMGLTSAKLTGLPVPDETLTKMDQFLDSVSSGEYNSLYGYTNSIAQPGTTAIGLLCRMYRGWGKHDPGIARGIEYLVRQGPSANNVYYDYYATQVMHHVGGPHWDDWNRRLRDHLVETQARRGSEKGSWYFRNDHGSSVGGRLYITAMSAMILEVYYRHMPIYSEQAVGDDRL